MVLRVAPEDFPEAVRQYAHADRVFVTESSGAVTMSAVDPKSGVIVNSTTDMSLPEAKKMLQAAGLEAMEGEWSREAENPGNGEYFVAAVAYRSKDPSPGLWVTAYRRQPTVRDVLRTCYEEFVETGEAGKATFDQFLNSAKPNVLILSPEDLRSFIEE